MHHIGIDVVMSFVMSKMYELSLLETSCHEAFPFIADDAESLKITFASLSPLDFQFFLLSFLNIDIQQVRKVFDTEECLTKEGKKCSF